MYQKTVDFFRAEEHETHQCGAARHSDFGVDS